MVWFLDLSDSGIQTELPEDWKTLTDTDVFDSDAFRSDFLAFLEAWPRKSIYKNKSFDQLFRRGDGYSVWWTSVGASRTGSSATVKKLKKLWILNRVMRTAEFSHVILNGPPSNLDSSISLRCHTDGIAIERNGNKTDTHSQPDSVGIMWLVSQLGKLVLLPGKITLFAFLVRIFSRAPFTRAPRELPSECIHPVVMFSPNLSRLVHVTEQGVEMPFWSAFLRELKKQLPDVRQKFLLSPKLGEQGRWGMIRWLQQPGKRLLEHFEGAVPPAERYTGLLRWVQALPRQIAALARYCRFEGSREFKSTFVFAGFDVFQLIISDLRNAVENIAEWERRVGMLTQLYSKIGNIDAVFVLSEFYPGTMKYIAAARRLGIPVVGVQHGTIAPDHYVYTVPQGHVDGAPLPNFFAVHGEYDREIVSELGAYPRDRVWIVGAPRMDYLVKNPPDQKAAREDLELPVDKKIILVATHTQRAYPWFFQVVKAVFEVTKNRNDCLICLKTHPGDKGRIEMYKEEAKNAGNTMVEFYADRFDELLAACDVLVSGSSTTVMEATLLGRATISANFSDEPDRYPYIEHGASLPARNSQELSQSLDILFSNDVSRDQDRERRRHAFLSRHLGPTADGHGANTLVEFVRPLLDEARRT